MTGKKSGKVGRKPSHSSSCFFNCGKRYLALFVKFIILFLLGGLNNPLSKKRIQNLINNAKYLFPELGKHEDEWLGFRPTLPDFLPVMGQSKNHKNLFYSFGHHHLGWTLGAISGKIISKIISGEKTNLNLEPYSSLRFS